MKRQELSNILEFTHYLYGLKEILRFKGMEGWEGVELERWDSVAEHSHRMATLAIMLEPYLEVSHRVNLLKTLKMVLVHDIVELTAMDRSPMGGESGGHAFDPKAFATKYEREMAASQIVFSRLPKDLGEGFKQLFEEYINAKAKPEIATNEGKFAYALDKIEAFIQVVDWRKRIGSWGREHFEKSIAYMHEWSDYDTGLKQFADLVEEEGGKLVEARPEET